MKTLRTLLLASLILSAGPGMGQSAPAAPVKSAKPGDNVVLHLAGQYAGVPIDDTWTVNANAPGQGGTASFGKVFGDDENGLPKFVTVTATVKPADSGYQVAFNIDATLSPSLASLNDPTAVFSMHRQAFQKTVQFQLGQPAVILDQNDKLTAMVTAAPDANAAADMPALSADGKLDENLQAIVKTTQVDGTSTTTTLAMAENRASAGTVIGTIGVPGLSDKKLSYESLTLVLSPAADALNVQATLSDEIPINLRMNSPARGPAATAPRIGLNYHNLVTKADVAVSNLGKPVTLFSGDGKTITLTVSKR